MSKPLTKEMFRVMVTPQGQISIRTQEFLGWCFREFFLNPPGNRLDSISHRLRTPQSKALPKPWLGGTT